MMGPLSWYGGRAMPYGVDDAGPANPGTVGGPGELLRCIGGPLGGQRLLAPKDQDHLVWEYPAAVPPGSRQLVTYSLGQVAHVPFPGAEGPVCLELVWLDEDWRHARVDQ